METGRHGTTTYTYDCFNRTEKIWKSNGEYIRNFYDPEGLRCKIEENGKAAWFIYDDWNIVAELEGEKLRAASIRGHELLMQKDGSGNEYYYLNNAHGDVEALIDPSGVLVNRYRYDAFGNIIESREKVHNRFKYAGEQYDEVTGQYYLRARFYNPVIGRFTQEDVYRGDGLNLYTYVQNNPIRYVDPSGYLCEDKLNLYKKYRSKGLSQEEAYKKVKKAFGKNSSGNFWDGMSRKEKGDMAEKITDKIMKKRGYKKLPSKVEGNHGIDGLYAKFDKNGNVKEIIVNETKFNKRGWFRLNKKTSMGPQMSVEWLRGNYNKMLRSPDIHVQKTGMLLFDNEDIIKKTANVISPDGKIKWFNLP